MKIIREAFGQIVNKVRPISKKLHKIEINENDNEWKLIQIVSDFGEKFADYNDQHFVLKPTSSLKYNKRVIENAFALTLDYYEKHGKIDSLKFVFPQIALFVDYDEFTILKWTELFCKNIHKDYGSRLLSDKNHRIYLEALWSWEKMAHQLDLNPNYESDIKNIGLYINSVFGKEDSENFKSICRDASVEFYEKIDTINDHITNRSK